MRKGITPIISIIVLLLITVALAGVAWVYLSGFLETQTRTLTIPPNGIYCSAGNVTVVVTNTGQSDLTSDRLVVKEMVENGTTSSAGTLIPDPLPSKESGTVTFACGGNPCDGSFSATLGTSGAVQTVSINC